MPSKHSKRSRTQAVGQSVVASTGAAVGWSSAEGVSRSVIPLFYAIIGRVAAEWAQLEHWLDLIIWELSGIDHKTGSCITSQLAGQYNRFNAIQALAASKGFDQKTIKRIETLSNRTSGLSKRRNRFVHDAWYTEGGEHAGQFKSYSAKEGQFGIHDVTAEYANETIKLIREKIEEISALRNQLMRPQSSP